MIQITVICDRCGRKIRAIPIEKFNEPLCDTYDTCTYCAAAIEVIQLNGLEDTD